MLKLTRTVVVLLKEMGNKVQAKENQKRGEMRTLVVAGYCKIRRTVKKAVRRHPRLKKPLERMLRERKRRTYQRKRKKWFALAV